MKPVKFNLNDIESEGFVFMGMKVFSHLLMVEPKQDKFPKTKRKRIHKKWKKKYTYYIPRKDVLIMEGPLGKYVLCHPLMIDTLKDAKGQLFGEVNE